MPNEHKRNYHVKDSVMLIAAATITQSAASQQATFIGADTSYTPDWFDRLRERIDNAAREILGADNAAALRAATIRLEADHDAALHELGLLKAFIESHYKSNPARRTELLNHLGFNTYHTDATRRKQEAMGHLLKRATEGIDASLKDELTENGLPPERISALRNFANTYMSENSAQEGFKDDRRELTANQLTELNAIYNEVIALCTYGHRLFKDNPALRDRFSFTKVADRQSAYTGPDTPGTPGS